MLGVHHNLKEMSSAKDLVALFSRQSGPRVLLLAIVGLTLFQQFYFGWSYIEIVVVILFFFLRGFVEWGVHAYIMHAAPLPLLRKRIKNPIYDMHIYHHRHPDDIDGLFFKGRSVFFLLLTAFITTTLISLRLSIMVTLCLALGLLMYEVFHMLSHSGIKVKNSVLMRTIMNHRFHHAVSAQQFYGVSSRLADKVLNTLN